MTECPACTEARSEPTRGGMFYAACSGCSARGLANSPMAARALAGEPADLQAAIERVWGPDNYAQGRAAVWQWIERIKLWKQR